MMSDESGWLYRPSWIDGFNNWVERLRIRPWSFYLILGFALILVQLFFLWMDSGAWDNRLLLVIFFNGLAVPYLLAMIQLLDNQAMAALARMRPVLNLTDEEFEMYKFRIANMPFLAPLLAGLAMTAFATLFPLVASEPESYAALEPLSAFTIVYHLIDKSSAFLFGVILYHTIRQLRLVNTINANAVRINIFQLRPVQSFSKLTASTTLALAIFFYGWMVINPELLADPAILIVLILFTALAVLIFAWPLWRVHRLMVTEKDQALQKIELQFEMLFDQFNQYVANEDHAAVEKLNGTIMSLEIQHNKVSTLPTWPWRTETARLVLTAVALPFLLMIVQFFVQQALGR